ncbi:hypothetical protein KUV65_06750 [Maritalea mobilis]|uniref:hypothetical protein n=1 Tax=Maritalea mobilis TaxID=483324 RepID=UPI001C944ECA|nr:hypothetical protein [Maritalea mobilis]MBY6201053.1 hypothetical protein [Maritalea mobilis]
MADYALSTPPGGSGTCSAHPHPSRLMLAFGQFLDAAHDLIAAEWDLCGHSGHDPAVDAWFRAAEAARARVLEIIGSALDLPTDQPTDQPDQPGDRHLRTVLQLFRTAMLSSDPDEIAQLQCQVTQMPQRFLALGVTGVDGAVNRLVLQGLDRLSDFLLIEEDIPEPVIVARSAEDAHVVPLADMAEDELVF